MPPPRSNKKANATRASRDSESEKDRAAPQPATPDARVTSRPDNDSRVSRAPDERDFSQSAPILAEFQDYSDGDVPEWLQKLFPDPVAWKFPVCDTKNGHLSGQLDPVPLQLERQAQVCKGDLRSKYMCYVQEWPVLRQSVIYGRLIATAVSQMRESLGSADVSHLSALQQTEMVLQGLLSDQLARAMVLMVGAQKIASSLRVKTSGFHPDLMDKIADLGPAPAESSFEKRSEARSASNKGSNSFKPVKTAKKSETTTVIPAYRASQSKSPSPTKRPVPGSVAATESGNN